MFEKIVLQELIENHNFLDKYGVYQFGFRKFSSTTSALISLHDTVTSYLDMNDTVSVSITTIDLSKAFDKAPHYLILHALYDNNLPHGFIRWYADYLSNRCSIVNLRGICSNSFHSISGVPQGSVLSPGIFCILMSSINIDKSIPIFYADDISLIVRHINPQHISTDLHDMLNEAIFEVEKLSLNINQSKTRILLINKHLHYSISTNNIHFDADIDSLISRTISILGITFNNSLTWSDHIENLVKKCHSHLYVL